MASLLEHQIGRRARADLDLEVQLERLPARLRRLPVDHPLFLIFGRQIPWAGGHITTFLPGAMAVPFLRVARCSALGIVPGAFFLAAIGAGLLQL
jgi:uncharacterized membrane protein YdjX (TVP38/TMEM64 family)